MFGVKGGRRQDDAGDQPRRRAGPGDLGQRRAGRPGRSVRRRRADARHPSRAGRPGRAGRQPCWTTWSGCSGCWCAPSTASTCCPHRSRRTTPARIDSARVGKLLRALAALHQFVLVDTPVGITEITAAALDVAELALLVTTPEVPALRRTHACLRMLQGLEFPTSQGAAGAESRHVQDAHQRRLRRSKRSAIRSPGASPTTTPRCRPRRLASQSCYQPKRRLAATSAPSPARSRACRQHQRSGWLPWRRADPSLVTA